MTRQITFGVALLMLAVFSAVAQTTQPAQQSPATQPTAGQLLDQMLRPSATPAQPLQPLPDPPAPDRTTGGAAVAPGADPMPVIREGSYIVDRTGRLTKSADGQQFEFNFESDGRAMKDPPVVILPNLKLMAMENAVSGSNRDLRFRITGMVTEYKGRNYVLLEKVVVVPDVMQKF
jgi:hypothetical protein